MRIIPAYAGSTRSESGSSASHQDHPRVCGEHSPEVDQAPASIGSSPRMRGALTTDWTYPVAIGIIPAYAGSTSG